MNGLNFVAKRIRSTLVKEMINQRQIEIIEMAICHVALFILSLSTRSMHDVACEFACTVRMRRNN